MVKGCKRRVASQWKTNVCTAGLLVFLLIVMSIFSPVWPQAYAAEQQQLEAEAFVAQASADADASSQESYPFDEEDLIRAQINHSDLQGDVIFSAYEVPLASSFQTAQSQNGNLLNTVFAAISAVAVAALLLLLFQRRNADFKLVYLRTGAIAAGLIAIALWALFDRLQTTVLSSNVSSAATILAFAVLASLAIISVVYEARLNRQQEKLPDNQPDDQPDSQQAVS